MFGRKEQRPKGPIYEKPRASKIDRRKKRISHLLRTEVLGAKEFAIISPLFGIPKELPKKGMFGGFGWGVNLSLRRDLRRLNKEYKGLYKDFRMRGLSRDLAKRKSKIDKALKSIGKELKTKRKAAKPAQKAQLALLENLERHLRSLFTQLTDARDVMYAVYQLGKTWQVQEAKGLKSRYELDFTHYEYDPSDTAGNVGYLRELKTSLIDKSLDRIDRAIQALVDMGPGVLAVLQEVKGLHGEAKTSIDKTRLAMQGRAMTAMDRISARSHMEALKEQKEAFSSMSHRAEKAAKMLGGEMKGFQPFVKTVGSLHKDLLETKKAFQKGRKREDYFMKVIANLDQKTAKLNQAATQSTRIWLLSQIAGADHPELADHLAAGKVSTVGSTLEKDEYFRAFTGVIAGGANGVSFPKEGIQIMIKDYPYQVRAFEKDLEDVYKSIHESNTIFLKQVSGATGKEEPDYVDNFANYLEARAKTIKKFVDDTAQTIIREQFPDNMADENKIWLQVLEKVIVKEMVFSNKMRMAVRR